MSKTDWEKVALERGRRFDTISRENYELRRELDQSREYNAELREKFRAALEKIEQVKRCTSPGSPYYADRYEIWRYLEGETVKLGREWANEVKPRKVLDKDQ